MAKFDIQSLLSDVSTETPCGQDISYDQSYLALELLVQPKQTGGVLSREEEVEEPNWREVCEKSSELLRRSKHLRVGTYLTLALLKLNGLPGLRDGLALLRGLLERYWDNLFPQLDPDDQYDPLERINILQALSPASVSDQDPMKFMQRAADVPLCSSAQMGRFSFRDIQLARGEIAASGDQAAKRPEMSVIDAAFQDTTTEDLQAQSQTIEEALDHVNAILTVFSERAAGGQGPNLADFQSLLGNIHKTVQGYLAKRGQGASLSQAPEQTDVRSGSAGVLLAGEIASSKEALLALEKVCRYFERHEPSSPVPLLLKRAQRLVSKSFLEVIADCCPDAMNQIELIGGIKKTDSAAE